MYGPMRRSAALIISGGDVLATTHAAPIAGSSGSGLSVAICLETAILRRVWSTIRSISTTPVVRLARSESRQAARWGAAKRHDQGPETTISAPSTTYRAAEASLLPYSSAAAPS